MADITLATPEASVRAAREHPRTLNRIVKYVLARTAMLAVTVTLAVTLTILIANMGGYVDEIIRNRITESLAFSVAGGWLKGVSLEEKARIIEETQWAMEEAAGLHEPFLLRTVRWLGDGLTLNWGESENPWIYKESRRSDNIRDLIGPPLARTSFVFGLANLLLFFVTVFVALAVNRKYGSRLDRLFIALSPISAAPAWIVGALLNAVFLKLITLSPGGTFDAWPDEFRLSYIPVMLRHLYLPFLAIFLSGLFQGVYAWRTFFLIYSNEEYVDMARAKGLSSRMVERRYILKPALPALLTSFALMLMTLWQEVIALEYFFNVAGIGRLFLTALKGFDTPMIVALVVVFAYLLAITVFLLDIVYALVDPRIRVQAKGRVAARPARRRRPLFRFWRRQKAEALPQTTPARPPVSPQTHGERSRPRPRISLSAVWQRTRGLRDVLRQLVRYPSAVVGMALIALLVGVAVYAVVTLPYEQAIDLWRGEGGVWTRTPRNALPTWVNAFRLNDLPPSIVMDSRKDPSLKSAATIAEGIDEVVLTFPFAYPYEAFPQDLSLYFHADYDEKPPHVEIKWLTPDGREIRVKTFSVRSSTAYHFSQDERLQRRLEGRRPQQALFVDPARQEQALQGAYELRVSALLFEEEADLDAEFVLDGRVYGLAGTDMDRRDLTVALLWGTVVALSFGVVAAVATSVSSMLIAAAGAWLGGWVDRVLQLLTEVNMLLPFFPVSLMIYVLYSKSIWVILGVTVLLSIFGSSIKTYRAIFLQVKESPYVEAARAYGASETRIVVRYLIPRIAGVLIPKLIILIPSYVFLEATLSFLGVSDPVLPTWGKLVAAAVSYGVYWEVYHLVLIPIGLLMLTGFAFAMVSTALERIFEPRLRNI